MGLTSTLTWEYYCHTDQGKIRKENQDSILSEPKKNLWAIADGMGGHEGGQVASNLATSTLKPFNPSRHIGTNRRQLGDLIAEANKQIFRKSSMLEGGIMGTTLLLVHSVGSRLLCLWVGDSRLYRFRESKLTQLSRDHNYEELQNDIFGFSLTNASCAGETLTRAIGAEEQIQIGCTVSDIQENDLFLLCTDGLTKELSDASIKHSLNLKKFGLISNSILSKYSSSRARDNVGLVILQARTP